MPYLHQKPNRKENSPKRVRIQSPKPLPNIYYYSKLLFSSIHIWVGTHTRVIQVYPISTDIYMVGCTQRWWNCPALSLPATTGTLLRPLSVLLRCAVKKILLSGTAGSGPERTLKPNDLPFQTWVKVHLPHPDNLFTSFPTLPRRKSMFSCWTGLTVGASSSHSTEICFEVIVTHWQWPCSSYSLLYKSLVFENSFHVSQN